LYFDVYKHFILFATLKLLHAEFDVIVIREIL